MKTYQVTITEKANGQVEVDKVFEQKRFNNRKKDRRLLRPLDKRAFTSKFLNSVEKFHTK
tara:strand:+ start:746 stop:925 length:180 start_codon:yes stop_codon:yes gene_type:complete